MRFLLWTGVEEWLTEAASVELGEDGLRANGIQLGAEPAPFRVDYRLEAPEQLRDERARADGDGGRLEPAPHAQA